MFNGTNTYSNIKKVIKVAKVITNITAAPIPVAVESLLDTPKKGHIPKNWENTILLTNMVDMIITINAAIIILFFEVQLLFMLVFSF